jgi:HSP20 family molecular chaperone IbpA
MQVMEQSARNTAEMVLATTAMEFFSMVHHIESCIGAKTLDVLKSRNWEGPLTEQDWKFAEALVLDPVEVSSSVRNDGMLVRLPVRGYRAEDIRLHMEGNLLCLCGYTLRAQSPAKMFYTRVELPEAVGDCRCAAWISDSVLQISLSREQCAASPQPLPGPIVVSPAAIRFAAAV